MWKRARMTELTLLFGDGDGGEADIANVGSGYREVLVDRDWTTVRWPSGYGATVEALVLYIEGFEHEQFVLFEDEDSRELAIRRDQIHAIS